MSQPPSISVTSTGRPVRSAMRVTFFTAVSLSTWMPNPATPASTRCFASMSGLGHCSPNALMISMSFSFPAKVRPHALRHQAGALRVPFLAESITARIAHADHLHKLRNRQPALGGKATRHVDLGGVAKRNRHTAACLHAARSRGAMRTSNPPPRSAWYAANPSVAESTSAYHCAFEAASGGAAPIMRPHPSARARRSQALARQPRLPPPC